MRDTMFLAPDYNKGDPISVLVVGTTHDESSYRMVHHNPDYATIEYIYSGKNMLVTPQGTVCAKAGDSYLLPPGDMQEYYSCGDEPLEKIWVSIGGTLINAFLDVYGLHQPLLLHASIENFLQRLYTTMQEPFADAQELSDHVGLLTLEMLQFFAKNRQATNATDAEKLKNYLDVNAYRPFNTEDLQQLISCSRVQVFRLFKEAYGCTPHAYHAAKRMEKACQLLRDTVYPIQKISALLGFHNEHYFSNVFRKHMGCSPKAYRAQHR